MSLVRPATRADVPLISRLIQQLAEYEREPHAPQLAEADLLRDGFEDSPVFSCLVAEADGTAAGFALYFPIYSTWQGRSLHLEDLFVLPEYRGRGLGRALLTAVADEARARGCARLQWDVLAWNEPALGFYRQLGAELLQDWRRMRISGAALAKLAQSSQEQP